MIALLTCFALLMQPFPALAFDLEKGFSGHSTGQAEFFNSNRDKRMQIQVSILAGVERPGIHQFPDNITLPDALALAGGLTADADVEKVFVKRRSLTEKGKFNTLEFDLDELIRDEDMTYPILQNYDTVLVDSRPKTDQKLLTVLTILASTVGIVSGAILIRRTTKN